MTKVIYFPLEVKLIFTIAKCKMYILEAGYILLTYVACGMALVAVAG